MKESTTKNIITSVTALGAIMLVIGLYLAIFTDIATAKGTNGIFTIAGLIAGGLFILITAKIYLTLHLVKLNDDRVKTANEKDNE